MQGALKSAYVGKYCNMTAVQLTNKTSQEGLNAVAHEWKLAIIQVSFLMLTKVCFGIVTLAMVASLTSKIYIVYIKKEHKTYICSLIINISMILLIGLTVSATSIATKQENNVFTDYTLKNILNVTSYEGYTAMFKTQIRVCGLINGPMCFFIAVMYFVICRKLFYFLSKPELMSKFSEF